ncbi:hypothetical protein HK100_006566, partial [Physocladia obscura]
MKAKNSACAAFVVSLVVAVFLSSADSVSASFTVATVPNPFDLSSGAALCGTSTLTPSCLCNPSRILANNTMTTLSSQLKLLNSSSPSSSPSSTSAASINAITSTSFSSSPSSLMPWQICVLVIDQIASSTASTSASLVEAGDFADAVRIAWAADGAFAESDTVLLLLDTLDHDLYISTGAAVRNFISDTTATNIATSVVSLLKTNDFDQAVLDCVSAIKTDLTNPSSTGGSSLSSKAVIGIIFGVLALLAFLGCIIYSWLKTRTSVTKSNAYSDV